jgi:hypothetical protein
MYLNYSPGEAVSAISLPDALFNSTEAFVIRNGNKMDRKSVKVLNTCIYVCAADSVCAQQTLCTDRMYQSITWREKRSYHYERIVPRFGNYFMKNRQSTCKYTITIQFTDLEKLLSHRKHADGGDCFPAETTSRPVCIWLVDPMHDTMSALNCSVFILGTAGISFTPW